MIHFLINPFLYFMIMQIDGSWFSGGYNLCKSLLVQCFQRFLGGCLEVFSSSQPIATRLAGDLS
ncbi:hypothetical protein CASFOL_011715 [Castilleja foliolosa]|uniref:Uncharacterized protein n=1 Tax=Castilleja foliolosa TaxID=1961234 RepID=A0ABD3DWA9_9LAMI